MTLNTRCLLRGGIANLHLSPPEALALLALNEYEGRHGIRPSQQTIEDGIGIKRENVGKIIKRLAAKGIIRIVEPGRQHKPALLELTVRCDAASHLHRETDARLTTFRCDAASHLQTNPDVTQRKHLDSPSGVTPHHTSSNRRTNHGLPGSVRSGPDRPSDSQSLRAADDDDEDRSADIERVDGDSRRQKPRKTEDRDLQDVPAQPQYARADAHAPSALSSTATTQHPPSRVVTTADTRHQMSAPVRTCTRHPDWNHSERCRACGVDRRAFEAFEASRRPTTMSEPAPLCATGQHRFDPASGYCAACGTRNDREEALDGHTSTETAELRGARRIVG